MIKEWERDQALYPRAIVSLTVHTWCTAVPGTAAPLLLCLSLPLLAGCICTRAHPAPSLQTVAKYLRLESAVERMDEARTPQTQPPRTPCLQTVAKYLRLETVVERMDEGPPQGSPLADRLAWLWQCHLHFWSFRCGGGGGGPSSCWHVLVGWLAVPSALL